MFTVPLVVHCIPMFSAKKNFFSSPEKNGIQRFFKNIFLYTDFFQCLLYIYLKEMLKGNCEKNHGGGGGEFWTSSPSHFHIF